MSIAKPDSRLMRTCQAPVLTAALMGTPLLEELDDEELLDELELEEELELELEEELELDDELELEDELELDDELELEEELDDVEPVLSAGCVPLSPPQALSTMANKRGSQALLALSVRCVSLEVCMVYSSLLLGLHGIQERISAVQR